MIIRFSEWLIAMGIRGARNADVVWPEELPHHKLQSVDAVIWLSLAFQRPGGDQGRFTPMPDAMVDLGAYLQLEVSQNGMPTMCSTAWSASERSGSNIILGNK